MLKGNQAATEGDPSIAGTKLRKTSDPLSEKLMDRIADRVVRRMSPDIIREVAWDVVPELSEILIRRIIEEQDQT